MKNDQIFDRLAACSLRPGVTAADIGAAERAGGYSLPTDYRAFLQQTNGLEGFLAAEIYIWLWSLEDIGRLSEAYHVSEFVPGVVLLGTDGGDTGYGFIRRGDHSRYVRVPLVGMSPATLEVLGETLVEFLDRLAVPAG